MSPRKSSTSSGNRFERPRYLLVEVAGVSPLSPARLEAILRARLPPGPPPPPRFQVVRVEGPWGLVAVAHTTVGELRACWTSAASPTAPGVRTLRTYGTLRKGKERLARSRAIRERPPGPHSRSADDSERGANRVP